MLSILYVVTSVLIAVAMALALAHALELPGKLRLPKDAYLTTQQIYYPGFTIGAFSEVFALFATPALLFFVPSASVAFWLILSAFAALIAMHAVYWVLIHPVNNFWIKGFKIERLGAAFFAFDPLMRTASSATPDWTSLRDRWEYAHVLRAALGLLSLILLVSAITASG